MKTSIEKEKENKIKGLELKIKQDKQMEIEKKNLLNQNYELVKDFTLSDNKTKVVLEKMKSLNSELKTITKRIKKNESELTELL